MIGRKATFVSLILACAIILVSTGLPVLGQLSLTALDKPILLRIQDLPFTLQLHLTKALPADLKIALQESAAQVAEKHLLPVMSGGAVIARKGAAIYGDVTVIARTEKGFRAELLLLLLFRETFTAEPAQAIYDYANGEITNIAVNYPYTPKAPQGFREPNLGREPKLEIQNKLKGFLLKTYGALPDDPEKFDYGKYLGETEAYDQKSSHSWWPARALANTACDTFPSAVTATNQIQTIFYYAGLPAAKRIGPQSTKPEINDFLYKDSLLLAWSNIGHGVTSAAHGQPCYGLVQWGGTQWWNEFYTSGPARGLHWCVCFVNSCNSFMNPLKNAIKWQWPRTYVGGRILLPVNRSEWSDRDFWYWALLGHDKMAIALGKASAAHGLIGAFGLDGFPGQF